MSARRPGQPPTGAVAACARRWVPPAPADYPFDAATPIEAEAGDVVIFSYFCVHGSGVNTSSEARTTLLVQLRSAEDRPLDESSHPSRGQGMMLRGIDPHGKDTFGIDS